MAKSKKYTEPSVAELQTPTVERYVDAFVESTEYYKPLEVNKALLKAIETTESTYIILSTPALEVYPDETEIEALLDLMDANPKIGLLQPVSDNAHPHLQPAAVKQSFNAVHFVQTSFLIIRREALLKAGFINERFTRGWGADIEWSYRFRQAGYLVAPTNLFKATLSDKNVVYPEGKRTYEIHAGNDMNVLLNEMFPDPNTFLGEFAGKYDVSNFWGSKKK